LLLNALMMLKAFILVIVGLEVCFALTTKASWSPLTNKLPTTGAVTLSPNATNLPQTTLTPPTLSPAHHVRYKLSLDNTGPAVLDSTVKFTANLTQKLLNASSDPWPVKFIYQWMNMADMGVYNTYGSLSSSLSLSFPSESTGGDGVDAGDFIMTVAAFFEDVPTKVAAFQTMMFTLTKKLNGELYLHQDLNYQRSKQIFSTRKRISLQAVIHDQFQATLQPEFLFNWYQGNYFVKSTQNHDMSMVINSPEKYDIKADIFAFFNKHPPSYDHFDTELFETDLKRIGKEHVKLGTFKESVVLKDPLEYCNVERVDTDAIDSSVKIGSDAVINVTCVGSPPLSVCFNISDRNDSFDVSDGCKPLEFSDTLHHQVYLSLNRSGWSDIHFLIYNDISRLHVVRSFYAYDPDNSDVQGLVYPTVFVFLGVIIFLSGVAYVMRLRKKPHIEVADFDFHPTLTESSNHAESTSLKLSKFTNSLKEILLKTFTRKANSDQFISYAPINDLSPEESIDESVEQLQTERKQYYDTL